LVKTTDVYTTLAKNNGNLPLGLWHNSLHVICGLTACTPGSATGPMLTKKYGKILPFLHHKCKCITDVTCTVSSNMTHCKQHQPPNSRHCDLRYTTVTAYFTCLCCTVGKKVIAEMFKYWLCFHHMTLWYRSICCCRASLSVCLSLYVHLSHSSDVSKWLNLGSRKEHRTKAWELSFTFLMTKILSKFAQSHQHQGQRCSWGRLK